MYRSQYKCSDCKHSFEKVTKNFPKKDPNCPKCLKSRRVNSKSCVSDATHNIERPDDFYNGGTPEKPMRTPTIGGQSNFNKALDLAANICMQDGNMTDINIGSNLRVGDNCAPKLSHEMERKVDEVFKPQKNNVMGMQTSASLNNALTSQINSGRYASQSGSRDITARAKESGVKIPTTIIHEHTGKPN